MAYDGMVLNEERANELFASSGRTSDAVLQQAVPILASAELQHRLEGPAETGRCEDNVFIRVVGHACVQLTVHMLGVTLVLYDVL